MNPELNSEEWKDIEHYVANLQNKMNDNELKKVLRKIGAQVKKKVKQYAPNKTQNPSYSDFGEGEYKHIKDDITYKVKKSSSGQLYVSVKGGKTTGYKWHWVNEGHIAQNGHFIPGTHFVDKAEASASDDINDAVDKFMEDLFKDG